MPGREDILKLLSKFALPSVGLLALEMERTKSVVYLCIKIYSMHSFFPPPGRRHACNLEKEGVSHLGLIFW